MATTATGGSPPAVALEGVGRAYGERVALRDVSFTLPAGATVAVFGANGAGKTTLLRILAGLLRPHAGRAWVLGAELPHEAHRARGRVGLLGHEPMLYRDLTVRENLRFHARLHGVDDGRIEELVETVGLAARADEPLRTLSPLIRKDLRLERRSFESVPAMLMFSVSTFVLFHFGLDRGSLEGDLAAGVLWVTVLLASVLGMNRLFVAEQEQGGFDGFLMAPVDRTALFVAKAVVLFCFLVAVELVAVPAFVILLLEPGPGQALPELLAVLLLADAGIAVVGTLIGALGVQTRARDLIVPLIALPLLVPVVIAASEASAPLFAAGGADAFPARWLVVLALYDAVFGLLAYAVFDFLLEE